MTRPEEKNKNSQTEKLIYVVSNEMIIWDIVTTRPLLVDRIKE